MRAPRATRSLGLSGRLGAGLVGLSALVALCVAATADARPGGRRGRADPTARPTFSGKRTPATTNIIKREPKRTRRAPTRRRARRGRSTAEPAPLSNHVYTGKTVADSGKLQITYVRSSLWKISGIWMGKSPVGRVDVAVKATQGEHVMLKCEVNPSKTDMVLSLTRDGGPKMERTLAKRGHQHVSFAIPNVPGDFDVSLAMAGPPGMVTGSDWVFYGCDIPLE